MTPLDCAIVREIADVLAKYPSVACRPSIEKDDDEYVLTVAFKPEHLHQVELANELRFAIDMASVRGIAARYGIDPAALEKLFHKEER